VTPIIFGIPSTKSPKPVKLENSKLVHSLNLARPTSLRYNILESGRDLGHVTPRKFGIPSTISQKPIKPESSKLVHRFILAPPTKMKYNICERGRGLGHVTLEFLAHPLLHLQTGKAGEF